MQICTTVGSFLGLVFALLVQPLVAITDFSITWIDSTIAVLEDERTILLQLEYTVGNIGECNRGEVESCTFVPTVHTESDEASCRPETLALDAITVRPIEYTATFVNVYIEVDVLEAPELIIGQNQMSLCVKLNSYAGANGSLLVNSYEVIQRADLTVTGSFVTGPATTEAFEIRDTRGDSFQVPMFVNQCSNELVQLAADGAYAVLCVSTNHEFWTVSGLDTATLERPATAAAQVVIEAGTVADGTTTVDCSPEECRIRFRIDPVAIGSDPGTLRFFGVAEISIQGSGRRLTSETKEQSFNFEFELGDSLTGRIMDESAAGHVAGLLLAPFAVLVFAVG